MARIPTNSNRNAVRPAAPAAALRISATRAQVPHPLPQMHFRAFIGTEEVHLVTVSPLHLPDGKATDPEIRQTVTLRRGVGTSRLFYDWNQARISGKRDLRDVSIVLLDRAGGRPVNIWQLVNARPVRWSGPGLDALQDGIAMEELELAYDNIAWRSRI
jgi:hypothetical protein